MLPRHTKSMQFTFTNKIVDTVCLRVTIPHTMINRTTYSKKYRKLKQAVAESEGLELSVIKGKHELITSKAQERVLFEWPGGIVLDMPDGADAYDYQIVLKQLEVLQMRFNRPVATP